MKIKIIDNLSYQVYPITDGMLDVDESVLAEIGKTKQFDVITQKVVDYVNSDMIFDKNQQDLTVLESWFTYYDRQVAEYSRCQRLGIAYSNDDNLTIEQLDELAEQNKAKINKLRSILNAKN